MLLAKADIPRQAQSPLEFLHTLHFESKTTNICWQDDQRCHKSRQEVEVLGLQRITYDLDDKWRSNRRLSKKSTDKEDTWDFNESWESMGDFVWTV